MRTLFKGWLDREQRHAPDPEATWVSLNRRLGAASERPSPWVLAVLSSAVAAGVYAAWPVTSGDEAPQPAIRPEVAVVPPSPATPPQAVMAPHPPSVVVAIPASPPDPRPAKANDYQEQLKQIFKSGNLDALRAAADAHVAESDDSWQLRNELHEFAGLYPQIEANPVAVGWAVWLDRRISSSLGRFTSALTSSLLNWRFQLAAEAARGNDWVTAYQVLGNTCEHLVYPSCPAPWAEVKGKAQERYLDAYERLFSDPAAARVELEEVLEMTSESDDLHLKAATRIKELIAGGALSATTLTSATSFIRKDCAIEPAGRRCQEARALQRVFAHLLNARSQGELLGTPEVALVLSAQVLTAVGAEDPEGQVAARQLQQLNALAPVEAKPPQR